MKDSLEGPPYFCSMSISSLRTTDFWKDSLGGPASKMDEGWPVRPPMSAGSLPLKLLPQICLPKNNGLLEKQPRRSGQHNGRRVACPSANVGRLFASNITPRKILIKYANLRTTGFLKDSLGGPASKMGERVACPSANVGRFFTFNITASNMLT